MQTLMEIIKRNGRDGIAGLIDEASKATPELTTVPARTIKGTKYKTHVRTALGRTTGSFRDANNGSDPVRNTYETREVEAFILEARIECDAAVAKQSEDGAEAFLAEEAEGVMEGESQGLASQFYYGRTGGGNSAGHPGLIDMYDATNMAVDAGGTTATTGSSCWLVRTGSKDVTWAWGENGQFDIPPFRIESIVGQNSKKLRGYVSECLAFPGLQVGSPKSVCRIKKLTEDATKGLTDALISKALAKFPAGKGPDKCFMSLRSLAQLQASRTATSPTGAPAPFPTSITGVDGQLIPIHVSGAIIDTESLTL